MKITIDYTEKEKQNLKITTAVYIGNYTIRINFNDGTEKLVNFKQFLSKSLHPSIRKYLDDAYFSNYEIVNGNLNWNDYDMIFPIWDLYRGRIDS